MHKENPESLLEALGVQKKLDRVMNLLLDAIEAAIIKNEYSSIRDHHYTVELYIKGDRFSVWNENESDSTRFYGMESLSYIPENRRAPFRELLREAVKAEALGLTIEGFRAKCTKEEGERAAKKS